MLIRRVAAIVLGFAAAVAAAQSGAPWDYSGKTGPLNWGKLDPAWKACSDGHEQSPIDLRGARLNKGLTPIEFHYISAPVMLENDGHALVAHVRPGGYILAGDVRYDLQSFSFHHPGEHPVKGKLTDMDVELLHKSSDGKFVIVVVRMALERGESNAVVAQLWPHLPKTAGSTVKIADYVNAGGFLPADRGYWTYTGSLTTPPCSEGVTWFVLQDAISVSQQQLRDFTSLFHINSRPVQEGHGRRVEANE